MADEYLKFAHGKKEDIATAIEDKKIDEHDVIFTSDTNEIYFYDESGVVHLMGARSLSFTSLEEAVEALNESEDTYAGQIIMVMDDSGNYQEYIVQNSGDGETYTAEPITAEATELKWTEF